MIRGGNRFFLLDLGTAHVKKWFLYFVSQATVCNIRVDNPFPFVYLKTLEPWGPISLSQQQEPMGLPHRLHKGGND
jgi:hypothetical protein